MIAMAFEMSSIRTFQVSEYRNETITASSFGVCASLLLTDNPQSLRHKMVSDKQSALFGSFSAPILSLVR